MLDLSRHVTTIDPASIGSRRIDVIGCGSIGSKITLELAKLGFSNGLRVWDKDVVEAHNLTNQAFGKKYVGFKKTYSIQHIAKGFDAKIEIKNQFFTKKDKLNQIVFMCVDTMHGRRMILDCAIKQKVELLIDTRMGKDVGRVYTIDPRNPRHQKKYIETLCSDQVAEVSVCGQPISVGPTSSLIASLAVWALISKFGNLGDESDCELLIGLNPTSVFTRQF